MPMRRLGLIVNPLAGLGGSVALGGSDGMAAEALRRGAIPRAGERAVEALKSLRRETSVEVCCYAGEMGEGPSRAAGLMPHLLGAPRGKASTADDTRAAARAAAEAGCKLLLFAGGDGTACDLLESGVPDLPMLGVPAGVKMQSSVFATTPAAAGQLAAAFLSRRTRALRDAEILDVDEEARRQGVIAGRLRGTLRAPDHPRLRQHAKARHLPDEPAALAALADAVASAIDPTALYLLGPGTTLAAIKRALEVQATLAGVDVIAGGKTLVANATERDLLDLLDGSRPARLIVSPIGGQGFAFGRGNQQLSPSVLRRIGRANIELVATPAKLIALQPSGLLVDTGDIALDAELSGWYRVSVGPGQSIMSKIVA
jgi:predicted polyphosphate/ATP-dependent NAD kinase